MHNIQKGVRSIADKNDNLKKGEATRFKSGEQAAINGAKGGRKSQKVQKHKKGIRAAMQDLLSSTYNLTDKKTGEVRTLTGEEAIALSIMNTAMNPKDKNWRSAVQYALQLIGEDKSVNENKLIEAQAKMLEAKADLLTGADTTMLDKLDDILRGIKEDAIKGGDK